LTFSRRSARHQTFYADILVNIRPVDSLPFADQPPTPDIISWLVGRTLLLNAKGLCFILNQRFYLLIDFSDIAFAVLDRLEENFVVRSSDAFPRLYIMSFAMRSKNQRPEFIPIPDVSGLS
jgi:hypothetical protein